MYQIDGQMDNQGQYQAQYENPSDMYAQQYYEDQQQFNEMQMINHNQQYVDGGYVDYVDEAQVGGQYAQNDLRDLPSYQSSPDRQSYAPYEVSAGVSIGNPQAEDERQDEASPGGEDQFTRLLNSLEARVDLMAQMQHTRAEIQKHTRNLQNNNKLENGNRMMALPSTEQPAIHQVDLEPERPFSSFVAQCTTDMSNARAEDHMEATAILGSAGARLVQQNAMLRNEFQDQKGTIDMLQQEVAGMKTTLRSISVEPARREGADLMDPLSRSRMRARTPESRLRGPGDILGVGTRVEARWMKGDGTAGAFGNQWLSGYISRANEDGTFQIEYDNGAACLRVPSHCLRRWGEADNNGADEANLDDSMAGEEVKSLQMALLQERQRHESSSQQWSHEKRRLLDELSTLKSGPQQGRRALGNLPTVGESSEVDSVGTGFSSLMHTNPVLPAHGLQLAGANARQMLAPLCRNPCGMNIELSEDGYSAKRIRGCRQSVVMGSSPLEKQELGHYFEVVVRETVNGWVGGLGIGVTRVSPAELKRMPDKAWRIPSTFIVGYWGCVFLDGREKRTRWKADTLKEGSRVGLLVTGDGRGDLIVFVDGEPVVRADDVLPSSGLRSDELYPVVDVFAATLAVELQQSAVPPAKPWSKDPSPPGSPGSVARSVCSSSMSVGTRQTGLSFGA